MVTARNCYIRYPKALCLLVLAIEQVADTLLVNFCQKYLFSIILHDQNNGFVGCLFLKCVFYTFLWLSEEKTLSEMRNMLVKNVSTYAIIFRFPLIVMERQK